MKKVLILLSSYNGEDRLIRQVESIFNQINVETHILIRDDGSDEKTVQILKIMCQEYGNRIKVLFCPNIGWKKSFLELIQSADDSFDYYGFSDQDDIWFNNKVDKCIKKLEENNTSIPKLCHCKSLAVDENFITKKEQEFKKARPKSHKNAIATEYFQGCSMIWNLEAMNLLKKGNVQSESITHDYWVGLIIYFFGEIYFVDEPLFYHIRYNNSQSSDGSIVKGRMGRLKKMMIRNQNVYMNPADDLINNYENILKSNDLEFLKKIKNYKLNKKYKIDLIMDREFKRNGFLPNLFFKLSILMNRF